LRVVGGLRCCKIGVIFFVVFFFFFFCFVFFCEGADRSPRARYLGRARQLTASEALFLSAVAARFRLQSSKQRSRPRSRGAHEALSRISHVVGKTSASVAGRAATRGVRANSFRDRARATDAAHPAGRRKTRDAGARSVAWQARSTLPPARRLRSPARVVDRQAVMQHVQSNWHEFQSLGPGGTD